MEQIQAGGTKRLLLRLPEAAVALGLGRSTVYTLIARGELPVVKMGSAVRIPADALEDWVRRNTVTSQNDALVAA